MPKPSKIKNNLSPICIPELAIKPSSKIKDEIKKIEIKYSFQDEALWQDLNKLTNWFQLEKELERQALRPADERKVFAQIKNTTSELLRLLDNSGVQVRNKFHDILTAEDFLKDKPKDTKRSALPYLIEETLEIFEYACIHAINHSEIDLGGNRPNSSRPKNIIFQLIKIYSDGSGEKPTCYDDSYAESGFNGKFYHFLLELNPILLELNQEMSLGTPVTIGDYAKECLEKSKKFNTLA